MNKYLKIAMYSVIGSALGYGYYYYIGCSNGGHCPLTSRWYITTIYGLVVGLIMAFPLGKKAKAEKDPAEEGQLK